MFNQHPDDFEPYPAANEYQNALAYQSSIAERDRDGARIEAARLAGRWVVVCRYTMFCPVTDGIMGSGRSMVGDYENEQEAREEVLGRAGCYEEDYETLAPAHIVPSNEIGRTPACQAAYLRELARTMPF